METTENCDHHWRCLEEKKKLRVKIVKDYDAATAIVAVTVAAVCFLVRRSECAA